MRRRIERFLKSVREVDCAGGLGNRLHACGSRIYVRADDVVDPLLFGQAFGTRNRQFGIVLIVNRHNFDLIFLASDLEPALLVVKLSRSFGTVLVDEPPGSSRTAHYSKNSYFQDFLGAGRTAKRSYSENENRNPNVEVATTKLECAHIFLSFPR